MNPRINTTSIIGQYYSDENVIWLEDIEQILEIRREKRQKEGRSYIEVSTKQLLENPNYYGFKQRLEYHYEYFLLLNRFYNTCHQDKGIIVDIR